jgi:demethylmenaquinone methyltransferase / 2-methoxy-6-polyprenyl-1,4-benzoquinol methylase
MEKIKLGNEFDSYNDYISLEWEKFEKDKTRYKPMLEATNLVKVRRVLDIGCGAGQELLPFIENGAFGVGIDVTPFVGQVGRRKYAEKGMQNQVSFANASGNELPFADESFDVLICRGALMFMNVKKALSEMSRVLAKNGRFFLMFQAPNYYWWKMGEGFKRNQIKNAIHASRVLISGTWFSLSGKQSYNRLTAGGETFVSRKTLKRDLKEINLEIIGEMPDTNPQTPSYIIKKK